MAKNSIMELEQDINLSHFTFENLHEAVFWINSKGNILFANEATCKMTGYSKAELTSMLITEVIPSDMIADFKILETVKSKKAFYV